MSAGKHFAIGVDVGGTKVAAGLVDSAGNIVSSTRGAMITDQGPAAAVDAVVQIINKVMGDARTAGVSAIGVSVPVALRTSLNCLQLP